MNTTILFIYNIITVFIPETKLFGLKNSILRLSGAKIAENVRICSSTKILGNGKLQIGENTWIGHQGLIISSSSIIIGSDVDIAPKIYIGTGTHTIDVNANRIAGEGISQNVIIGNGCWIGVNSTILPGVTVGRKNMIAAGSVVTKSTVDYHMYGGVPARLIKKIS